MRKLVNRRLLVLGLTVVMTLFLLGGVQAGEVLLGARDAGYQLELAQSDMVVLSLECNPSTGYIWSVKGMDRRILKRAAPEFEFEPQSDLLGAPGKQILRFMGVRKGRTALNLVYHRPWEKDKGPLRTFSVQVRSRGPFKGVYEPKPSLIQEPVMLEEDLTAPGLPAYFNWCDQINERWGEGCTSVKSQGNCGSCWAFATVGPFENMIKYRYGNNHGQSTEIDLSEQYLVSCNTRGWGCDGGSWAHSYHVNPGAVLEEDFPYTARDSSCRSNLDHPWKLDGWSYIRWSSSVPSVADIKQAIYDHGPVSAALYVGSAFRNYRRGVFSTNESGTPNHAITLVGWDDSKSAWRLRNSWGTGWGEGGYMWIRYGTSKVGYGANYIEMEEQCKSNADCDDGFFCNGAETCVDGFCREGTYPCPDWACDEIANTCVEKNECYWDEECEDGNDCTIDACVNGLCSNECASTVTSYPYAEGFESGWGGWVNVSGDDMDWTRDSGSTPSSSTGPSGAHSGSYYLYTEASSPNYPNKTALLESPCLDLSSMEGAELTFWYHMYGSAMGSLSVEVSEDCKDWTTEWSQSGDQGNGWHQARVNLVSYNGSTVKLRFRGVTGSSYRSDMAIDDVGVTMRDSNCPDEDGDGYSTVGGACGPVDCDDIDPAINPGATEVCDGVDNNCDGEVDEGVKNAYYWDGDGDGYGSPFTDPIEACSAPEGYVSNNTDCDDTIAAINPGAAEVCDDGVDNDCDGDTDSADSDCGKAGCGAAPMYRDSAPVNASALSSFAYALLPLLPALMALGLWTITRRRKKD